MNFISSIVRKATRTDDSNINVLAFVNPQTLIDTDFTVFYESPRMIDIDVVICDEKNYEKAAQYAVYNHVHIVRIGDLSKEALRNIILEAAHKPYLNHEKTKHTT